MPSLNIVVIFAVPDRQHSVTLTVPLRTTVLQALELSGLLSNCSDLKDFPNGFQVGVWSKRAELSQIVNEGDRLEIYRPITADPKVLRLQKLIKKPARSD